MPLAIYSSVADQERGTFEFRPWIATPARSGLLYLLEIDGIIGESFRNPKYAWHACDDTMA